MVRKRILLAGVMLVLITFFCLADDKVQSKLNFEVVVDPRVELMSIIFRLARSEEYCQGKIPSYVADVEEYFKPYKKHSVIQLAKKLRKTQGVGYDAVMSMAVHITDIETFGERVPFEPYPETLDSRWTLKGARQFLEKARAFSNEADFKTFFDNHSGLYNIAITRMQELLTNFNYLSWADKFFGARPKAKFVIVVGMLNGSNNYGTRIKLADGSEILYAIIGASQRDEKNLPRFDKEELPIIVHEFGHSYTNPLVIKHLGELKEAGEKIFPYVSKKMAAGAYGSWKTMWIETINRACVIHYLLDMVGEEAGKSRIEKEIIRGFICVPDLVLLLEEYKKERSLYPTLDSFFPKVVALLNQCSKDIDKKLEEYKKKLEKYNRSKKLYKQTHFIEILPDGSVIHSYEDSEGNRGKIERDNYVKKVNDVWVYKRNHTPIPETDYTETVQLPENAQLLSVKPRPTKQFQKDGKIILYFKKLLKEMEAFKATIKYKLDK
jgi:hypothetical protein